MTNLGDLLRPDSVRTDVPATSRKAVLAAAAGMLAAATGLEAKPVADALADRERLGTTGFGHGVALPHGRAEGLTGIQGAFLRLARPVGWAAVDDAPVDLVFAMLSPSDAGADHLKALARASRRLRDRAFLAKLRGAGSRDALWALLAAGDQGEGAA